MADLTHRAGCPADRVDEHDVDHRGGRAQVRRCLDCGSDAVTWLVEPRPDLPDGVEPIRVPNPQHEVRIR